MTLKGRCSTHFFAMCMTSLLLTIPNVIFSQTQVKGKVVYKKTAAPAAYATVEVMHQKGGSITDNSGNFSLYVSRLKKDDTLMISSVGYQSLKIPVSAAMKRSEFELDEDSKNLETIVVKSFTSKAVQGSTSDVTGYFRSWNYGKTGGEIGRIFKLPYSEYKIDKLKFKVNNRCDTCQIRLHIRRVVDDYPGEELLSDSITVAVASQTMEDEIPEFDLSAYNLTFKENKIFVSMEVLNCTKPSKEDCSFCFAGSEEGKYIFKSKKTMNWQSTEDYTIYLKLFLSY